MCAWWNRICLVEPGPHSHAIENEQAHPLRVAVHRLIGERTYRALRCGRRPTSTSFRVENVDAPRAPVSENGE